MDKDFVLHAEHGLNASSFAARICASTVADLHSAVTAGIATLKGPAHGGAAEAVMQMALEIGDEANAADYVKKLLKEGGRVTGLRTPGIQVCRSQSRPPQRGARALGDRKGQPKWFAILQAVADAMEPYARRGVSQNVDFWTGAIYYLLHIPEDLFISIFAMGRIPGWALQVMEQFDNNILLRPRLLYEGPMDVEYVPIDQRG